MSDDNITSLLEWKERRIVTKQNTTNNQEVVLDENKIRVLWILKNSTFGNLIDFSSEKFNFVINNIGIFAKDNITIADINRILSYDNPLPEIEMSDKLLETLVFRRIAGSLDKKDYDYSGTEPVKNNEARIDTLNDFEAACCRSIWLYGEKPSLGKTLTERLMERNMRRRIRDGTEHNTSQYINEKMYLKTRERLINEEDVYLGVRNLSFIVTNKL